MTTIIFDLVNNDNKKLTIAAIYAPSDANDPFYFETVDNILQKKSWEFRLPDSSR